MTASIPTTEPQELRAGLTWQWRREDLSDYPASAWTLTYWFKQLAASGAKFSIEATADGDAYAVEVAKATTQSKTAGEYSWAALVSDGTDQFEVDQGTLTILPRYDADTAVDDRSHARIMLDAIELALQGRASKTQLEYTIGNRSVKHMTHMELEEARDKYRAEVYAEEQAERVRNGGSAGKLVVKL